MILRTATGLGAVVALLVSAMLAVAQTVPSGEIIGWGSQVVGGDLSGGFEAVTAGHYHSLGLKEGGSIAAWGWNRYGQCSVPEPNMDFVAAAGYEFSLGLTSEGFIVAWGRNTYGQCDVPAPNTGFIAVAPGTWYIMVYGALVPGEGDFTLEATLSQLKVTSVVPNSSPSTAEAVLTISGAGFDGEITVELVADGGTAYPADAVEVDSFTQIMATFLVGGTSRLASLKSSA